MANKKLEENLAELVRRHNIAVENLTQKQVVEAIKQAIEAGDFQKHVNVLHEQQVVYVPFAREQELHNKVEVLQAEVKELQRKIEAVGRATGHLDELEAAERAIMSAQADARNWQETAFYGSGK